MGNKASPKPEGKDVYLATKDRFTGEKAKFRQLKTIRKVISKTEEGGQLEKLVAEYGLDSVCQCVQGLLNDEIYEFASKASALFPELFQTSSSQTQESAKLEVEAAHNEEIAVQEAVQNDSSEDQDEDGEDDDYKPPRNTITLEDVSQPPNGVSHVPSHVPSHVSSHVPSQVPCQVPSQGPPQVPSQVPSLFPIYFPFDAEHLFMERLQMHLERVSFGFGQDNMPDALSKRNWNCPELIELNKWARFLGKQTVLNSSGVETPSGEVLRTVAHIRHTAVHRLRTNSKGLERFLYAAEDYVKALENGPHYKAISQLKSDVGLAIEELRQDKRFLLRQREETQARINEQRAELDRLEKEALAYMIDEDEKYQRLAGDRLKKAILLLEDSITMGSSKATTKKVNDYNESENEEEDEFHDCNEY